jgi:hypothetical protein
MKISSGAHLAPRAVRYRPVAYYAFEVIRQPII